MAKKVSTPSVSVTPADRYPGVALPTGNSGKLTPTKKSGTGAATTKGKQGKSVKKMGGPTEMGNY